MTTQVRTVSDDLIPDGDPIVLGQHVAFAFTVRITLAGTVCALRAIDVMTFDDHARIPSQRAFVDHSTMAPEA